MPDLRIGRKQKAGVYVGLGSNMNNPEQQIKQACVALGEIPETELIRCSSFYRSTPLVADGAAGQPDYINAVALLETRQTPYELLDCLKQIERCQGRVSGGERWGPRPIDLDILLYGDKQIMSDGLIIPHPGLTEREFVLYPLYEIAPALSIPGHGSLEQLRNHCPPRGLQCLEYSVN